MNVTASAPGKLILCGEHAVVYGRPALVAAVDLRLTARLAIPADGPDRGGADAPVRLSVPVLDLESETTWGEVHRYSAESRKRWQRWADGRGDGPPRPFSTVRADAPDHLLKVALGEAAAALGETADDGSGPPLEVQVDSELPTGSGFGSSAAAAVALVAAYLELRSGLRSGGPVDLELVERLALEVERRQHGSPSGVDGATVLHGGMVWAERDAAGDLRFQPFPTSGPGTGPLAHLAVYDTGRPAEGTGTVVAEVRQGWRRDESRYEALWDEMEAATRAFRAILEGDGDAGSLGRVIRRSQRALEEIGVVPDAVRKLVRTVEEAGGAAKISGAGSLAGPGAGTLLVHHPEPAALDELPALSILPRFPVRLGAPGLRLDPDPQEAV